MSFNNSELSFKKYLNTRNMPETNKENERPASLNLAMSPATPQPVSKPSVTSPTYQKGFSNEAIPSLAKEIVSLLVDEERLKEIIPKNQSQIRQQQIPNSVVPTS